MKLGRSGIVLAALILVSASCSSTQSHADHTPRHGGIVLMYGDLHYEVVLDPKGRHRVYFSDAVRAELPAAVASEVTTTVNRREGPPETLKAQIDESGKSWVAQGEPVDDVGATARIAFTFHGKPYFIDLPFGFGSP